MKLHKNTKYIVLLVFSTLIWGFGMRFILVEPTQTHYHANFAMFFEGNRDPLENFTFYEEVSACSADNSDNPRSRVHLHDQNPYTIHVHDEASTWGHLLANLGYGLTNSSVMTRDRLYVDNDEMQLRFVLNGRPVNSIANKTIQNEDVLLIDYGDSSEATLLSRYNEIPKDAAEFNKKPDPAACAGEDTDTFTGRLKYTLGL